MARISTTIERGTTDADNLPQIIAATLPGNVAARLAVLIDADNAQPAIADGLLLEVANTHLTH